MIDIVPDIKIKGHLVLGDQQMLDENNIFRKYHHFFTVIPNVNILGLKAPFGRHREVELDDDEGYAAKNLAQMFEKNFGASGKPNFTDAAAALVLAHVSRVAQGSMIARDAAITKNADTIKTAFVRNFGAQSANKIEYDAGIAFINYARALPDLRDAHLKKAFVYK